MFVVFLPNGPNAAMPGDGSEEKKKCHNFSVQQKLSILNRIDAEGVSIPKIAREYGLCDTTVRRWKKKRKQLEAFQNECSLKHNKRMKTSPNSRLNEALYIWYCQNKRRGVHITGPILKGKAFELNELLGQHRSENFQASDGWLTNWKARHGIALPIHNSAARASPVDFDPIKDFKTQFAELKLGDAYLTRSQIFSCDNTGLKYKSMPPMKFIIKEEGVESALEYKQNEHFLNVMACSNADGSFKLPLVVIGRSAEPKSLKNMQKNFVPVYYTNERSSVMDSTIFATWFKEQFVPRVKDFLRVRSLPLKAVLLLENSASHLASNSLCVGQIKAIFLPPHVTTIIPTLDDRILQRLRVRYKLNLLKSVLNAQDDGIEATTYMESISLRDVFYWMSSAWNEVSGDTIYECCKELFPKMAHIKTEDSLEQIGMVDPLLVPTEESFDDVLDVLRRIHGYLGANAEDVRTWLASEDDVTFADLTDDQIIQRVLGAKNTHCYHDIDNEDWVEEPVVTEADALQGIETAIRFFEQRGTISLTEMSVLLKAKGTVLSEKINVSSS